jgi:hypothetical protein
MSKRNEILMGQIETVTMMDLRNRMGEIFLQLKLGKVFLLSSKGKEVAVLSKPPGVNLSIVVDPKGKETYKL